MYAVCSQGPRENNTTSHNMTHFTCKQAEITKVGDRTARLAGRPPGRLQQCVRAYQNRRMAPGRPGPPARTNLTKQQAAYRHKSERSKGHAINTLLLGIRPGSCGPLARHTATYTTHEHPQKAVNAKAQNTQSDDGRERSKQLRVTNQDPNQKSTSEAPPVRVHTKQKNTHTRPPWPSGAETPGAHTPN
jgi:hypothetical protein